jgi:hypothetical protein
VFPVNLRLQIRLSCLWAQALAAANSRSYWSLLIMRQLHRGVVSWYA